MPMMSREDLLRVHITVITTLNARLNFGAEEWDVIDIHEIKVVGKVLFKSISRAIFECG